MRRADAHVSGATKNVLEILTNNGLLTPVIAKKLFIRRRETLEHHTFVSLSGFDLPYNSPCHESLAAARPDSNLTGHGSCLPSAWQTPLCIAISALVLSVVAPPVRASCWHEAAARYQVSPVLLYAIAKQESALKPDAVSALNSDGSYDIGLMQINSKWLPALLQFGITERHLHDGCTSAHVGAWMLAQNFKRFGFTWRAVGAYNAKNEQKRSRYARAIHRIIYPARNPGIQGRS